MTADATELPTYPTDTQVDDVLAEFGGDARQEVARFIGSTLRRPH